MAGSDRTRRRVRAIRDRLREMYGQPVNEPHGHPIAELIKTVLSQHTNDRNRDRAFAALRERFPTWEEVRDAPVEEVEEAIRPGGLGKQKAPRIQAILEQLGDPPTSTGRETRPRGVARVPPRPARRRAQNRRLRADLHLGHPGDPGRRPRLPRGQPARALPEGASFEEAHDEMLAIVPPEDAYELHMNLIRHGRETCRPKPRCEECALRRMCPWYRAERK